MIIVVVLCFAFVQMMVVITFVETRTLKVLNGLERSRELVGFQNLKALSKSVFIWPVL